MCAAGVPVFIRSYASVMNFPRDYVEGHIGLQGAKWRPSGHNSSNFLSPNKNAIAWYERGIWHVARRHRTACFDPTIDPNVALTALGVPSGAFVIPTTIVVPLKGVSSPSGVGCHCVRIYPGEHEPPHEIQILGERVEFRVCVSEHEGQMQTFVEANFGGARFTADKPRRAVYLSDHKLLPSVSPQTLAAHVLLHLPRFVQKAGYVFDPSGWRTDIPRVGSYGVLPHHGSFYAELRWPAPSSTTLLAFDATSSHRVAQAPVMPAEIVTQEDEVACAMSSHTQKRKRAKPLPNMASVADAVRSMKLAMKLLRQKSPARSW
jgi:hypothetical protein